MAPAFKEDDPGTITTNPGSLLGSKLAKHEFSFWHLRICFVLELFDVHGRHLELWYLAQRVASGRGQNIGRVFPEMDGQEEGSGWDGFRHPGRDLHFPAAVGQDQDILKHITLNTSLSGDVPDISIDANQIE